MANITREVVRTAVQKEVTRQTSIAALEDQADRWDKQVHDGAYSMAKDLRDYLAVKAQTARDEARRLRLAKPGS